MNALSADAVSVALSVRNCGGYPSHLQPYRPARICTGCAHYERDYPTRLSGFSRSGCESFHAMTVGHGEASVQSVMRDEVQHSTRKGGA
jgi:hypothetical protein